MACISDIILKIVIFKKAIVYFAFCLREVPENCLYVSLVLIVVQIQQGKDTNIFHSA